MSVQSSQLHGSPVKTIRLETSGRVYELELDLPSLGTLTIEEGDTLEVGQVIAKLPKSLELISVENDLGKAKAKLKSLNDDLSFKRQAHDQTLADLQDELMLKQEEKERLEYLLTQNAVSKNKLEAADSDIQILAEDLTREQAEWRREQTKLEQAIRNAQADIKELEMELEQSQQALELKTPVAGEVLNIRTVKFSADGVTVLVRIEAQK